MSYMTTSERQVLLSAELAQALTHDLFRKALEHVASAFGFSHFSLIGAPAAADMMLMPLIIETSLPMAFLKEFDRSQLLRKAAMFAGVRESVRPHHWHIIEEDPSRKKEGADELHALLLANGLSMGSILPVSSIDGQRLIFCFVGNRSSLTQSEMNELSMLMLGAVDAYDFIRKNGGRRYNNLSVREVEVVRWTAQGKTSVEIGRILSLSDHTVNAYMTSAIRKLDCVNRTQLVAKAIRLKLIG